jgi:hypothetical protein
VEFERPTQALLSGTDFLAISPTKASRLPESIILSALEELGCARASPILCLDHALVNMFQIGMQ